MQFDYLFDLCFQPYSANIALAVQWSELRWEETGPRPGETHDHPQVSLVRHVHHKVGTGIQRQTAHCCKALE